MLGIKMYSMSIVCIARFCHKGSKYLKVSFVAKHHHTSEAQQHRRDM